ncbi:MAG TPA: energy transducer TonB [Prolixibacteraceae bacterium]|jgi:hypothetical protein
MITKPIFIVRMVAVLSFFLIASTVFSQKVIYIGINGKLTTLPNAIYMQKVSTTSPKASKVLTYMLKDSKWEKIGSEQYKKLNDSIYQINVRTENFKGITMRNFVRQKDGTYQFKDLAYEHVIRFGSASSVAPLLLQGQVTEYYEGGKKKSVSKYNNNELVSNENWNADGTKYIDNVFYSTDSYPFFNPGNEELHKHLLKGFRDAGIDFSTISGSMKVGFVVMEDGTIDGIKIVKGLGPIINGIAVDSFASLVGTWTPAKLNNHTVRYFQVFPINFKSDENHVEFAEMRGGILHFQTY